MSKAKSKPHHRPTLTQGPDRWAEQPILFCGHEGYFIGDVVVTPFAVVITSKGNKPVTGDNIIREGFDTIPCWHISDDKGGYWGNRVGIFVLPREAVTVLR